jgi:hypothetical protein
MIRKFFMSDAAILTIYNPPKDSLPYLVVAIFPNGEVRGVSAESAADAQAKLVDLGKQVRIEGLSE